MKIDLPAPPSVNAYWRRVGNRTILSRAARDYKTNVAMRCVVARCEPLDGPLTVSVWWRRQRKAGDLDNIAKGLLDAVRGYLYHDDKQIVELHLYRFDDRGNAGVTLEVLPAGAMVMLP